MMTQKYILRLSHFTESITSLREGGKHEQLIEQLYFEISPKIYVWGQRLSFSGGQKGDLPVGGPKNTVPLREANKFMWPLFDFSSFYAGYT